MKTWIAALRRCLTVIAGGLLAANACAQAQPTVDQMVGFALAHVRALPYKDYANISGMTVLSDPIIKTQRLVFQPGATLVLRTLTGAIIYADELFVDTDGPGGDIYIRWGGVKLDGSNGVDYGARCTAYPFEPPWPLSDLARGVRPDYPQPFCTQNLKTAVGTHTISSRPNVPLGNYGWDGQDGEMGFPHSAWGWHQPSPTPQPVAWNLGPLTFYVGKITTRVGATLPSLVRIHIFAGGLNGGNGGNGGQGQSGANGGKGTTAETNTFGANCKKGPGDGGDGGNAGAGGKAGDGANGGNGSTVIILTNPATAPMANFYDVDVSGGTGGRPGLPGNPGTPGVGGKRGDLVNNCLGSPAPGNASRDLQDGHDGQTPKNNLGAGKAGLSGDAGVVYYRPLPPAPTGGPFDHAK